ncbi:pyrroloquinoline quinone biosynthesis protein B (Coenzyme PQQ synthesis protein B/G) [Bradyrhizobium sp. ORS 285]|uniref:pyrroloquinoline quinone biosynthesis protein PqqB n=1 Tax=Bradyrhizobium sp. ORS 285 TaxID=115808 RepID=UPI0002405CBA|nr:pyrroloquinoline quinone biosynthesis protein PqqB [Bradyrhizobium sp. ORS 285]CCD88900.1 pyrroloquinoline quinone biosynthesis protein B (Coenzyme PQQ synthesis protein B/G) [Bradyrhizobium sp. ORS 285]SMX56700.1 pyrroloquinoline quinone biosynthesis protein B (Coenzyme PQQ synthesis protein B/G) [Bradyrhizobium sp. ORS 285]
MLRLVVLGAAAGGGVPQWNCGCAVCRAARTSHPEIQNSQASVAVSADGANWFLINASPDLRQQVTSTPQLHPKPGALRHSPIAGVILTNGEIDAVTGLLSMRESSSFSIHAHPKVLAILRSNNIFDVLKDENVKRVPIVIDVPFRPLLQDGSPSGLEITAFAVSGTSAWYLRDKQHPGGSSSAGDTLGLKIEDVESGQYAYVIAACADVDHELRTRLKGAPLVLFDGTVWRDDEMIQAGLGNKTGQSMGHIAMSGESGAIKQLADLGIGRKIFLHINNSNPAWLHASPERQTLEREGWEIPAEGMEIVL